MTRQIFATALSRTLLALTLTLSSISFAGAAHAASDPAELPYWTISMLRERAKVGDYVSTQGRVVRVSESRFYTLEDDSGDKMIVVIPDFLRREQGSPESGETIRVHGKFDHKTLLDAKKASQATAEHNWGIRVARMERNVPTTGLNPDADTAPSMAAKSLREDAAPSTPAAPVGVVTVATPNTPEALKSRLRTARKRALAAREDLESANAASARAEYKGVPASQQSALSTDQARAQTAYDEALAEIAPLVEQAHSIGLDPKVIELYEAGLTKPAR